jgi:hypothetical protein
MSFLNVLSRIFAVFLGLLFIFPAGMASDSGTIQACNGALTLLVACLLMILSGVFGNLQLFALGVLTLFLTFLFVQANETLNKLATVLYLCVFVPVAFIWILGYHFQVLPFGLKATSTMEYTTMNETHQENQV